MAAPKICVIPGCGKVVLGRGWCPAHYDRWRKYGDPLGRSTRPKRAPLTWLSEHLDHDGHECLIWPFGRTGMGYGVVYVEGGARVLAHRWVCEQTYGPPPAPNSHAAHGCGNGHLGCVSPKHLRWATPKENGEDRVAHGTVPRGSTHGNTKLLEHQALAIYALKGMMTGAAAGLPFGVTRGAVSAIWRGQTWAWLTGEPPRPPARRSQGGRRRERSA
jgi:hypothetical protein